MANRYWVGGSGTWSSSNTANWSSSSGGAGGASVPTSTDNVFFDQAGPYSVTLSGSIYCADFNVSAGLVTFVSSTPTLYIYGSILWYTDTVVFSGAAFPIHIGLSGNSNISTGGTTIQANPLYCYNAVSLQSALTLGLNINITSGATFSTNGYTFSMPNGAFYGGNATLNFSSSTISVGASTLFNSATFTVNAGTSQINFSYNASITISPASSTPLTLYNVAFTGTPTATTITHTFLRPIIFNNFSILSSSTSYSTVTVLLGEDMVVNGTLTTSSTDASCRVLFASYFTGLRKSLTVNSAPSISDTDFVDIYCKGTAAPISGTRVGDKGNCYGITFSAPKTVYWNNTAGNIWNSNSWTDSIGGTVSLNNYPLPQDTAKFVDTGRPSGGIIYFNGGPAVCTLDASGLTINTIFNFNTAINIYGDLIFGNFSTPSSTNTLTFKGSKPHYINTSGKTLTNNIVVDCIGGSLTLSSALNIGSYSITVTNGDFSTNGYSLTCDSIISNNSNIRSISLSSSTVTAPNFVNFLSSDGLTFDAGTSTIYAKGPNGGTYFQPGPGSFIFNNVILTAVANSTVYFRGYYTTFNNLTVNAPINTSFSLFFENDITISGTLTTTGYTKANRVLIGSLYNDIPINITVNNLSLANCSLRGINIKGSAQGTILTDTGNAGNNTGVTFPTAKTVYINATGTSLNFTSSVWALSPGGLASLDNYPLAHDSVVLDNTATATAFSFYAYGDFICNNFDMSARTSAITINGSSVRVQGYISYGSGIVQNSGYIFFSGFNNTQYLTTNGANISTVGVYLDTVNGKAVLADATTLSNIYVCSGSFDTAGFTLTASSISFSSLISSSTSAPKSVYFRNSQINLTGTSTVLALSNGTNNRFDAGTSTVALTNNTTSARQISGTFYLNNLIIGGNTSTSTTTIAGNNFINTISSTKTVAHTIALGSTTQTFGKWLVSGSAGNVVTVTGTGGTHKLVGSRTENIDYLAMGSIGFDVSNSAEFYAGANSTGTNSTIIKSAAPSPVTRYWVGGTGTWAYNSNTNWSATSGGAGGASAPTSVDTVVFNILTAHTVTIGTGARCGDITISGGVTFSGTGTLNIFNSINAYLGSSAISPYTGIMTLRGYGAAKSLNMGGAAYPSKIKIEGSSDVEWVLVGGSYSASSSSDYVYVYSGKFNTNNYTCYFANLDCRVDNFKALSFGSSQIGFPFGLGSFIYTANNLSIDAGTSTISISCDGFSLGDGTGKNPFAYSTPAEFNNISFLNSVMTNIVYIYGHVSCNTFSIAGRTAAGVSKYYLDRYCTLTANSFVKSASTSPACRTYLSVNYINIPSYLNVTSYSGDDIDFSSINAVGTQITGNRLGDCSRNSGIVFDSPKTVYYRQATSCNWGSSTIAYWSLTSGGTATHAAFPLAQDTAIIESTYPTSGYTLTIDAEYNIGTIDATSRTTPTTISRSGTYSVYGDYKISSSVTVTCTAGIYFKSNASQNLLTSGTVFPGLLLSNDGGSLSLLDSLNISANISQYYGTFNANGYNVTFTTANGFSSTSTANYRSVNIGSGTWTIPGGTNAWSVGTAGTNDTKNNITISGTGTIVLSASSGSKYFTGGSKDYSGITLVFANGGALTLNGNNTFKQLKSLNLTNGGTVYLYATTTSILEPFDMKGASAQPLVFNGSNSTNFAKINYKGSSEYATQPGVNYISTIYTQVFPLNTWYAGTSSTVNTSSGWVLANTPISAIFNIFYSSLPLEQIYYGSVPISAVYYGETKVWG